jgi:serine/threonine protein kinase
VEVYCTRPTCNHVNVFPELSTGNTIKTVTQKFCVKCGMPLILAGRYLTERLLARGGFGAAYLARDRYTPAMKRCVVKQLLPTGLSPDQMDFAKELFDREGAVLEELGRHPQIPDLLAFFEVHVSGYQSAKDEIYFYLAQEFIDGITLEKVTEQYGALPEVEVLRIMKSLLPVLQFVHDNNSIHRDIKPSNIMLKNSDDQLYLLDFGAVKQATVAAASQKSTGIFTPGFGAPEQMRGDKVFPSTDLYAFAATCVVMLTGKQPEDLFNVSINKWEWRHQTQVSPLLGDILDRMLQNAPSDRFANAQEVLDMLNSSPLAVNATATPVIAVTSPPVSQSINQPISQPVNPQPISAPANPPNPIAPLTPPQRIRKPLVLPPLTNQLFAAFLIGFESGLVAIAAFTVGTTQIGLFPSLMIVGGIVLGVIFLRVSQIMDNKDLLAADVVSILLVLGVGFLFKLPLPPVQIMALLSAIAGISLVAVTTLFRLIYTLLFSLL